MIDQDYVEQTKAWMKSMEWSIQQEKNYIKFHEDEIEIHSELKACTEKQLLHDERRLEKAKAEFDQYLKDNSDERR